MRRINANDLAGIEKVVQTEHDRQVFNKLNIIIRLDVEAAAAVLEELHPTYNHSRYYTLALLHKIRCRKEYRRILSPALIRLSQRWLKEHGFSKNRDEATLIKEGFLEAVEEVEDAQ